MIETIFTSSVIAAIVAAIVVIWTTQRKIAIENITQERQKWREKIREKSLEVHDSLIEKDEKKLNRLRSEFEIILNPFDEEDKEILNLIKLPNDGDELKASQEFTGRVSYLLKHDWQRVKLEAGATFCRLQITHDFCKCLLHQPPRNKYKKNANK